jgi:mxaA protein
MMAIRTASMLCVLLLALTARASEQATAEPPAVTSPAANAIVQQPRTFGYFLGDVVTQRVLLELDRKQFEPEALPRVERVGVWFERRPSRIVTSSEDGRRWLILQYQIMNAPRELQRIELPALTIAQNGSERTLVIPAVSISVSPLTSAIATDNLLQNLRPDRDPPQIPTYALWWRTLALAAACAIVLALWVAWIAWRNWSARTDQPFGRAWEQVRHLNNEAPEAWQALHRAFDQTAGSVIQASTLARLFSRAPHIAPLSERIERFYVQSSELFFGRGLPANALSVRELCRDLRQLERRHEG